MDAILIRDLPLEVIVGVYPEERRKRQRVNVDLELSLDLSRAGESDDFHDALNYAQVEEEVKFLAEKSEFFLLEKLASVIASHCLSYAQVQMVSVTLDKPKAPRYASSIAVRIHRTKTEVK